MATLSTLAGAEPPSHRTSTRSPGNPRVAPDRAHRCANRERLGHRCDRTDLAILHPEPGTLGGQHVDLDHYTAQQAIDMSPRESIRATSSWPR